MGFGDLTGGIRYHVVFKKTTYIKNKKNFIYYTAPSSYHSGGCPSLTPSRCCQATSCMLGSGGEMVIIAQSARPTTMEQHFHS